MKYNIPINVSLLENLLNGVPLAFKPTPLEELAKNADALLLDPVYAGKAFAAILVDIKNGSLTKNDTVVFIHTGGLPLLFSDASILQTINDN